MALVVLPDIAIHQITFLRLQGTVGPVLCNHRSGRPWILGKLTGGELITTHNRNVDIAAIGHSNIARDDLEKKTAGIDSLLRTERLAAEIVEFDVLLFAHDGNQLRAYAPLFQSKSLFWTTCEGLPIVSDEQYPLASLNGFEIDHGVLTTRLVNAEVSHPFTRRPIWKHVDALGTGEYLAVADGSAPQRKRWWSPPAPERPLIELTQALAAGIDGALRTRTAGRSVVSADLSGGLDSTTLCFFAAGIGLNPHTLFMQAENKSNNDWKWSDRAAREISSRHMKVPYQSFLKYIADETPASISRFPEGPGILSTTIASAAAIGRHVSATGSTLHLNRHAGGALFGQVSSMVWSYFRSGGRGRYKWLLRYRTMNRIPLPAMLRMLMDRSTFSQELSRLADGRYSSPVHRAVGYSGWIQSPRFPYIFTGIAKQQFRNLAQAELEDGSTELSTDRTVHQILSYLTAHGAMTRRMNHVSDKVQFDSPYLDKRVVEAATALNHRDRTRQYPAKPLLAAARPPAMSLDYFLRKDKGDYTPEVFDHNRIILRRARDTFSEGSVLGEIGLVSDAEVVRLADSYSADGLAYSDLINLEFAERWLRSVRDERDLLIEKGNQSW